MVAPALLVPAPLSGCFDEFSGSSGQPREHQVLLSQHLQSLSPTRLQRLRVALRERISAHEVTFNILGAPGGSDRPWPLDLLPLVIERQRWAALSEGLSQRARLMSALYADVYGRQQLVKQGTIPAQLILGNPQFHRSCVGWTPRGGHVVHLFVCDVGVGPEGRFEAYADRASAPAGWGYALESRLALGTVLGSLFNRYGVERLRGFFAHVHQTLHSLVDAPPEETRVVVLSPGLADESSFEHAYLTRYLGYELAEGRDLTVRDRVVYLKTLAGLRKVNVVLRRVHDRWCDPVALRQDSALGVAGLLQAAAAGNVALVNPLGVGVIESPGLKPYLAEACRALLGEELLLPSAPSYWCGDPQAMAFALDHLDGLVFKPSMKERSEPPIRPAELSYEERSQFVERLRAQPGEFVAEEWRKLSVGPYVGPDGTLQHGHLSIRTFLCRSGRGYSIMPGGIARVNVPPDGLFLSIDEDSFPSKDIWIPSGQSVGSRPPPSMPDRPIELRRGGLELPSRLLDDLYWLGRYIERVDATARLLRAGFERLQSEASDEAPQALERLAEALCRLEVMVNKPQPGRGGMEDWLRAALWGPRMHSNLQGVLGSLRQLTQRARSRLSRDAWRLLRRLGGALGPNGPLEEEDPIECLEEVLALVASIQGCALDNMVRSHAWTFLDMGRRVERGTTLALLLRCMLEAGASRSHMEVLLEVADSLLTYRARYLSRLQVMPVVDLLLTDDTNPRSVVFQAISLRDHVAQLPQSGEVARNEAERCSIQLESMLLSVDLEKACAGAGDELWALLEEAVSRLWSLSDAVSHFWLSHTSPSRALAAPAWVNQELEEAR